MTAAKEQALNEADSDHGTAEEREVKPQRKHRREEKRTHQTVFHPRNAEKSRSIQSSALLSFNRV